MPHPPPQFHAYPVLIIGGGGAGLRTAIEAASHEVGVAVISKVPPTRSHTVAAQGGINAALGNVTSDDWRWHAYDTIRGSDWLGDQDAIGYMCRQAPQAIAELDAMGVPFTRDAQGRIYQRPYGGMSTHYGKGDRAFRACAAADRTGDAIMTGLYRHARGFPIAFFEEYIALDLLMDAEGACFGCLAWELASGTLHLFASPHTILATGGYGQVYKAATASSTCTGDGHALALRAGVPVQDMEFIQCHPTGLYGSGVLISEAVRAEGGVLRNRDGEAFMARYAPNYRDLASRDVVTRAIVAELAAGRGCGQHGDHVWLDARGIEEARVVRYLPGTRSLARELAGVDITRAPIPVVPTAHYTMGGIPTNLDGQALGWDGAVVPGLYSVGEAACTSVHGANRLGCNSLLDLVVFGKRTGAVVAGAARRKPLSPADVPRAALEAALARLERWRTCRGPHDPQSFREQAQAVVQQHGGILRDASELQAGCDALHACFERFQAECGLHHHDLRWNNGLVAALEAENLILQGRALLMLALARRESRGAHIRRDYPERDDAHWLCHSLLRQHADGTQEIGTRPVRLQGEVGEASFPPEVRAY